MTDNPLMNHPLVSVIIPVFNGERYLAEALESVRRQAHRPLEIIVVDDGSADGSARIARETPGVRCIRQANQGAGAARNTGLAAAGGDLLALLDADDLWPANKLAVQVACLQKDPDLQIVMGQTQILKRGPADEKRAVFQKFARPWLATQVGCALFRADMVSLVGPFATDMTYGEDLDWFLRVSERGAPRRIIPEVTLYYRWHGENMCQGKSPGELGYTRAIKRSLDRRRKEGEF
ncbi:MAG: glycosyltransferase family 2 protein [Desulfobacterales bacterium]|nr:glycosyltransferase family 2 protein [Desulfobacterales bacterium]